MSAKDLWKKYFVFVGAAKRQTPAYVLREKDNCVYIQTPAGFAKKVKQGMCEKESCGKFNEERYLEYTETVRTLYKDAKLTSNLESRRKRKEDRKMSYNDYISSTEWQAKRAVKLEIIKKSICINNQAGCEWCAVRPAVEVHHLTYERLGNERMPDLAALCAECHAEAHKEKELLRDE